MIPVITGIVVMSVLTGEVMPVVTGMVFAPCHEPHGYVGVDRRVNVLPLQMTRWAPARTRCRAA
jgi:hypothetical protein